MPCLSHLAAFGFLQANFSGGSTSLARARVGTQTRLPHDIPQKPSGLIGGLTLGATARMSWLCAVLSSLTLRGAVASDVASWNVSWPKWASVDRRGVERATLTRSGARVPSSIVALRALDVFIRWNDRLATSRASSRAVLKLASGYKRVSTQYPAAHQPWSETPSHHSAGRRATRLDIFRRRLQVTSGGARHQGSFMRSSCTTAAAGRT